MSGICVSLDYPYLAASPDGIIDDDNLIEVKCPYVASELFMGSVSTLNVLAILKVQNPLYGGVTCRGLRKTGLGHLYLKHYRYTSNCKLLVLGFSKQSKI
jgi:hypothetical protein